MNALIERLGWMLLHSLWEGAVVWLMLQAALLALRKKSAQARYLAACLALVLMAVLPWLTFGSMDLSARLRRAPAAVVIGAPASLLSIPDASSAPSTTPPPPAVEALLPTLDSSFADVFFPWLVGGWLLGVIVVAGRWWISWRLVRRLAGTPVSELSAEWLRRFGELCRRAGVDRLVRIGETAAVTVPLVVGWLKPVILLPLGVLAELPAEQVEAIILHELAHIRRHDFLVNLLQSVVETLFFYHPAVASISHRIRAERECVCDDLSVAWCRDPLIYAEALTTFEEYRRQSLALAATGEGDLLPRIRRIAFGVEPRPRLAGIFAAVGFLAMGAYLASMFLVPLLAAELMTDQERVAKIQSLQPSTPDPASSFEPSENVFVTGTLRTEDNQPLPKSLFETEQNLRPSEAKITSTRGSVGSGGGLTISDPHTPNFYAFTQTGRIEVGVWAEGYAPFRKTIIQAHGGKLEVGLVLRHGFSGEVQLVGPDGKPIEGATVTAASIQGNNTLQISMPPMRTDAAGKAAFGQVEGDSEIRLNAVKAGWQMTNQIVSNWAPNRPLVIQLQPALPTSGLVIDQVTRRPIAGATMILAARRGEGDSYVTFAPENGQMLGHTDDQGRFHLDTLAESRGYYIYAQAAGYPVQSFPIDYGQQDRVCELAPGFHLRGKILDPKHLLASKKYYHPIDLQVMYDLQATPFNGYGRQDRHNLAKLGAEIPFDFEHLPSGRAEVVFAVMGLEQYRYELNLQKNVDDYVIDLSAPAPADSRGDVPDPRPLRKVQVLLQTSSGERPTGSVAAGYLSSKGEERWITSKVAAIQAGQATISLPVPTKADLYADQLVGYWFAPEHFDLPAGTEPFPRKITVTRAGVIHGKVRPSSNFENQTLFVLPVVIKPPPGMAIKDLTSGTFQTLTPQHDYVTPPLPFGGTYAVVVDANPSYFVSETATVDAGHPIVIKDVDLKQPTGVLKGKFVDEVNHPISYQEVMLTYHPTVNDVFTSHSATTGADGSFTIPGVNFDLPGNYDVQLYGGKWEESAVRIDAHTPQPVIISVKRR